MKIKNGGKYKYLSASRVRIILGDESYNDLLRKYTAFPLMRKKLEVDGATMRAYEKSMKDRTGFTGFVRLLGVRGGAAIHRARSLYAAASDIAVGLGVDAH